jgi:orotate phosphoribosyltransferase
MTDASLRGATVEELFARSGALLDGHFVLKSGRHAGRYLEKFLVLQHPELGVEICRRFAEVLEPYRPTLVVGPTTGGVLLSFETARQLGGRVRAALTKRGSS